MKCTPSVALYKNGITPRELPTPCFHPSLFEVATVTSGLRCPSDLSRPLCGCSPSSPSPDLSTLPSTSQAKGAQLPHTVGQRFQLCLTSPRKEPPTPWGWTLLGLGFWANPGTCLFAPCSTGGAVPPSASLHFRSLSQKSQKQGCRGTGRPTPGVPRCQQATWNPPTPDAPPGGRCPGAPSLLPHGTHKPFLLDRKALREAQAASTQTKALGPAPPEASGPIAGSLPEASPHSDVVADASPSPGDTSPNSSPAKANLGNSRDKEIYPGL